jgi:signal peptidase I
MRLFLSVSLALVLTACAAVPVKVRSAGMEPTIKMGDEVRLDKSYYSNKNPQRFDVIAVRAPLVEETGPNHVVLLKRVIAVGGETLEPRNGAVFINGSKLEEPYATILAKQDFGPVSIPGDEYFLLGDNRPESWDSRFWKLATVKKEDIVGKVTDIIHK